MYIMLNYNITRTFDTAAVAVQYCWHPPAINCEPRQLTVTSPGGLMSSGIAGGRMRLVEEAEIDSYFETAAQQAHSNCHFPV